MVSNVPVINPCGDQHILYVDIPMVEVLKLDNYLADVLNNGSHIGKTWTVTSIPFSDNFPYTATFTFATAEEATWVKLMVMK